MKDESFIIPSSFLEIIKPFKYTEIPYCKLNEINSNHLLKKLNKMVSEL